MNGVFAEWQPRYAAHGITTFPVTIIGKDKKPAVKGYLKLGSKVSDQLALKFPLHDAIGLACRRNRITVLDVDTPDERILADGLSRHGPTPFIVRSGSGHYQAWYRHYGERRRVRPDPTRPIDILGDGYVVAPPSRGGKGPYEIIQGSMDDLDRLPRMKAESVTVPAPPDKSTFQTSDPTIREGNRNDTLWRHCMKAARGCAKVEDLMEVAVNYNKREFFEPLSDVEVLKVVASALAYESQGKNWFGHGARIIFDADEVDDLMDDNPDAFILLTKLRRHHWGRDFMIANAMADDMPGGGWRRQRLAAARQSLLDRNQVEEVRPASRQYGPAIYRFKGGQK